MISHKDEDVVFRTSIENLTTSHIFISKECAKEVLFVYLRSSIVDSLPVVKVLRRRVIKSSGFVDDLSRKEVKRIVSDIIVTEVNDVLRLEASIK